MGTPDTRQTILDVAEQLFAEQGFAATSLRQLTARAGVNIAAVNYHFGSKDDLAKATLARRIAPINQERLRRLDALPHPATIEQVVRAFLEPVFEAHAGPAVGMPRLFGRICIEQPPFLRELIQEQFGALGGRFVAALADVAPGVDHETLWWRMHFTIGALAHTLQQGHLLTAVTDGACAVDDQDHVREQLIGFVVGGLAAGEGAR